MSRLRDHLQPVPLANQWQLCLAEKAIPNFQNWAYVQILKTIW